MQESSIFKIPSCRSLALIIFVLCLLCSAPNALAEYRTYEIESLRIVIDSDWPQVGAPGYFPVRFDITNLADAREIQINASESHYFDPSRRGTRTTFGMGEMGKADVRQTVRLKRGDRVKLTMNLPVFADSENISFRILEGGKPLQGFSSYVGFQSARPLDETPVLLVASPSSSLGILAGGWPRPVPSGRMYYRTPSGGPTPRLDFFLDPERLPTSWLGFTTLRAVLIGPSEWKQLTPPQQDALLTWTASGGDLLLVDGAEETVFPPTQGPVGPGGSQFVRPYFFGHIHLLKSTDTSAKGFAATINAATNAVEIYDWALPANRARDWGWIAERGFRLPIEGVGTVPTRVYLSILGLFLALIGPVNYIYLWRKRRQVLMVVTVPLISGVFILLLTSYGLLFQGFDVRTRAVSFTMLDQSSRRAATRASVSMYPGGVSPSGGVRFASDTAVFPIGTDGNGARSQLTVDLTNEQRFQSGLLQARTPGNFEQIEFQPARQRLSFERNGSELNVVNGLGGTVRRLFYKEGGQIYALDAQLPTGERGSLKIQPVKGADLFAEGIKNSPISAIKFQQIVDSQSDGSYLAVLETSPFWDPGVAKAEEHQSLHLVFGYTGGQP